MHQQITPHHTLSAALLADELVTRDTRSDGAA